jgi:hypothetical protein
MSQYQIMIKAKGAHHEGHSTGNRSRDADFLLSEFLEKMRAAGHEIIVASFSADNTTQMLVGSPRDVNSLDELYGISSNPVEDETEEDTGAVSLAQILNEIQGLREEHTHTHQTLVEFIDYEKEEDSDDPKKRKPRAKKNKEGGAGKVTPEPENKTPDASDADEKPADEKTANAGTAQEGETGASALTQSADEGQTQETQGTTEGDTETAEA